MTVSGCHFDLVLEDGDARSCRTWRLQRNSQRQGNPMPRYSPLRPLVPHRLIWLEPRSAAVSGGRGWAERVMAGSYQGNLPDNSAHPVELTLLDGDLRGQLRIQQGHCSIRRA